MMQARLYGLYVVLVAAMASAGCELIEGIFKAGMWVGILMVVVVVGLILMVLGRIRG